MTTDFDNIPETALAWHRRGRGVALATVTSTWGSALRPVGAQMVIADDREIAGSVSGGCVEAAVIAEALAAIKDGQPRLMEFGVTNDEAFAAGLACGGEIKVMIEPVGAVMGVDLLADLVEARAKRRAVAYVVNPEIQRRKLVDNTHYPDRFRRDKSGYEGDDLVIIHNPPLKMIVIGAVHIAQPLLVMARLAEFDTLLIDPRPAFCSDARFPDQAIVDDWPDAALAKIELDARTAIVTLSHAPKIDDPAIKAALESDVFYLGCLGSSRTHEKRLDRLHADGFSPEQTARIHGPVGLDINSKTPAEIAISIMAEITQTLRGK
ncbi:MAG TPA: XdhC/CoxI family protein [Rhodobacteraceae bacterium]|nr:XdhC/CoxI family protein [Paracoccaceae bacterium]